MKEILFASTNKGKQKEMREIASLFSYSIIDPSSLIERLGPVPDVAEGESSYRENALLKAQAFLAWASMPVVADDTGLEVLAFSGAPGVKSARYAGQNASMEENKSLLLKNLKGKGDRSALFRSVLCYIAPDGIPIYAEGELHGSISLSEEGKAGFGYDSLFVVGESGKTLSSLKGEIFVETHRFNAFKKLCSILS